jgi:urea transport system substrate-binding protein
VRLDGQFDIVWSSSKPVRPIPFPIFRTRSEWETMLENLHRSWGGRWVNPAAGAP